MKDGINDGSPNKDLFPRFKLFGPSTFLDINKSNALGKNDWIKITINRINKINLIDLDTFKGFWEEYIPLEKITGIIP